MNTLTAAKCNDVVYFAEKRLRLSSFRRNLSYPLVMLLLLALTVSVSQVSELNIL